MEVNEKLLQELKINEKSTERRQPETEEGSLHSVAEAFHNYIPYLKLYSLYAKGYQEADNLLQVRFWIPILQFLNASSSSFTDSF